MTLTPYAVLLLRPSATDDEIRQRFHALAKTQHPDRDGAGGTPGPLWYALSAAYTSIKRQANRDAWERAEALRSRRCAACKGAGTTGGRLGGVKVCAACLGTGRFAGQEKVHRGALNGL
jgi:DnaJ-class molecular chaperone